MNVWACGKCQLLLWQLLLAFTGNHGEFIVPKDKTSSTDNTHRVREGKEHDPVHAMSKPQYQRDEKLGMKPSQSCIVKCSSKGLFFLSKRKEKKRKENSNKYFHLKENLLVRKNVSSENTTSVLAHRSRKDECSQDTIKETTLPQH